MWEIQNIRIGRSPSDSWGQLLCQVAQLLGDLLLLHRQVAHCAAVASNRNWNKSGSGAAGAGTSRSPPSCVCVWVGRRLWFVCSNLEGSVAFAGPRMAVCTSGPRRGRCAACSTCVAWPSAGWCPPATSGTCLSRARCWSSFVTRFEWFEKEKKPKPTTGRCPAAETGYKHFTESSNCTAFKLKTLQVFKSYLKW